MEREQYKGRLSVVAMLLPLGGMGLGPPPERLCKKCGRPLVKLDTHIWQCSLNPNECREPGP
jgi:hypothetical protein